MPKRWMALAAVACGTFMATLDSSIVNIALPTLTRELGTELNRAKWVVIAYLITLTSLLLPFGRLSDQYGRKRTFQSGFLVFTLGSAFCVFAETLTGLVIARALQGIGASLLMANGPAIITAAFPSKERGTALGALAMVVSVGLISGPSIGGFLITHFGWESIFLVNVPIGLIGIALAQIYLADDTEGRDPEPALRFDWLGAVLQFVFLCFFMATFSPPEMGQFREGFPWARILLGVLTLGLGLAFYRVELRAKAPILDIELLRIRTFWTANLAGFLTFVAYSSVSLLMPFFLQEVEHLPPNQAGLFMTAIPLTIFVVAPLSGWLSDRLGSQELSFAGAFIGAIGLFVMSGAFGLGLHEGMSHAGIVLALVSIGLASGLFQSPNNNAIMSAVPPNKLGAASALLATIRSLGLVVGTAVATAVFHWRQEVTGSFVSALHFTHFVSGLVAIGAMVAALGRRKEEKKLWDGSASKRS